MSIDLTPLSIVLFTYVTYENKGHHYSHLEAM